jgi:predicted O-methyltransferase YrrM
MRRLTTLFNLSFVLSLLLVTATSAVAVDDEQAATSEPSPDLEDVLGRWIDAMGGRSAIEQLTTRRYAGEYVEELGYRDPPRRTGAIEIHFEVPDRWETILRDDSGTHRSGCDGRHGWRQHAGGVDRDDNRCRSLSALLLDPRGPLRLRDYYPELILKGVHVLEDKTVHVVEATKPGGEQRRLYFDTASGLLVQVGGNRKLQDYRPVDGILVPHRMEISRKGGWSAYEFRAVTHGEAIDDSRFAVPDLADALPDIHAGIDDPHVLPMLEHLPYAHGGMNVPACDGRLLYDLVVERGYRRGLEIGTSNGYSTLWLGLAFRETGGRVITIEYEPQRAAEARDNFRKAGLDPVIDLRVADAFEEIPQIEGKFDFVFLDAWKPDYIAFWEMVKNRVSPGGVFTAHNVIGQENHMRDFLEAIRSDPNFETTINEASDAGVSISTRRE